MPKELLEPKKPCVNLPEPVQMPFMKETHNETSDISETNRHKALGLLKKIVTLFTSLIFYSCFSKLIWNFETSKFKIAHLPGYWNFRVTISETDYIE